MKKSILVLWIGSLVLALAIGFSAASFLFCNKKPAAPEFKELPPPFDRQAKKNEGFKQKMDQALGLSEEQIAKLDSNGRACDSLRRDLHKQIRETEHRLHDILDSAESSEADLLSVRAKLLLLNERRLDIRIADIRFFRSVLTPEQFKKLQEMDPKKFATKPDKPFKNPGEEGPHGPNPEGPRPEGPQFDGPQSGPQPGGERAFGPHHEGPHHDGHHNPEPAEN